jgi:hypothetical protein
MAVRRGRWAAWLAVLSLGAWAASGEEPLPVQLRAEGPPRERALLEASLRELLSRAQLTLEPPSDRPALARVEVRLGDPDCAVSVVDRAGAVVVSRQLPRSPSQAVTLEAVATVVHAAVVELAEQERHPLGRRVLPPPLLPVEPLGEAPPLARVDVGAFLTGRAFGAPALAVFGGGLWAGVRLTSHGPWAPRLALHASWTGPFDVDGTYLQLSVQAISLRLLGGVRLTLGPTLSVEGSVGAGVDAFALEGRSSALPPQAFEHSRLEASPVVGAVLGVRLVLSGPTALLLGLSVDVDLLPRRYVTVVGGDTEVLFEAWRVRPGLVAGFTFELGGGGA